MGTMRDKMDFFKHEEDEKEFDLSKELRKLSYPWQLEVLFKKLSKIFREKVKKQEDYLEANYTYEDSVMSSYEVMKIFDKLAGEKFKNESKRKN